MKKRYVLKNKRRFMTIVGACLVLTLLFLNPLISSGTRQQQYATVYVGEGDTLWSIAARIDPDGNIRKLIYEIKRLNGMQDEYIQTGAAIKVPL
jgi:hypothetical protein